MTPGACRTLPSEQPPGRRCRQAPDDPHVRRLTVAWPVPPGFSSTSERIYQERGPAVAGLPPLPCRSSSCATASGSNHRSPRSCALAAADADVRPRRRQYRILVLELSAYFLAARTGANREDPVGLLGRGAPEDECSAEVQDLIKWRKAGTSEQGGPYGNHDGFKRKSVRSAGESVPALDGNGVQPKAVEYCRYFFIALVCTSSSFLVE
jgi:hypothetical protein